MPDGRKTKVETNGFKTLKDIAPASAVGCYDLDEHAEVAYIETTGAIALASMVLPA